MVECCMLGGIFLSLKRTVYFILLIFSLVPLILFATFMIDQNNKRIEEVSQDALSSISSVHLLSISSFFETQQITLEMISGLDLVQEAVQKSLDGTLAWDDSARSYLTNVLAEQKAYHDYIETLTVVDRNYMIVASGVEYPNYEDATELSGINPEYLTGDFVVSDAYDRNYKSGTKRVVSAYQGIYTDGELVGYVIEEIPIAYFDRFRTESGLSEKETYHILDGNLSVITAGTCNDYLEEIHSLGDAQRNEFQKKWDAIDHTLHPSGFITFQTDGVDYITYYSVIPCTDWGMRITTDLTARQQSAQEFRTMLYIVCSVFAFVFIIASVFLARAVTAPIDYIVGILKKVQDTQDYSLRLSMKSDNELGFLSEKVNDLLNYIEQENIADKMKQYYLALEAESDPLTGVKNKKALAASMQDLLCNAEKTGAPIAIGFLDIDDFRDYNTHYGHQQGDRVIQFVARTLSEEVQGVVGRTGGDEFAFCIPNAADKESLSAVAQRILDKLNGSPNGAVPCSIGIVLAQGSSLSYTDMIQQADEAMYRTKENGKNGYYVLVPSESITK